VIEQAAARIRQEMEGETTGALCQGESTPASSQEALEREIVFCVRCWRKSRGTVIIGETWQRGSSLPFPRWSRAAGGLLCTLHRLGNGTLASIRNNEPNDSLSITEKLSTFDTEIHGCLQACYVESTPHQDRRGLPLYFARRRGHPC